MFHLGHCNTQDRGIARLAGVHLAKSCIIGNMKDFLISKLLPPLAAGLFVLVMAFVLHGRMSQDLQMRDPGLDIADAATTAARSSFDPFSCKPIYYVAPTTAATNEPGDGAAGRATNWPSFRGPNLDGIAHDESGLLRSWPSQGPRKLWQVQLGEGYAAPAVRNGRVYLLDYDPPDHWLLRVEQVSDFHSMVQRLNHVDDSAPAAKALRRIGQMLGDRGRRTLANATDQLADATSRQALIDSLNELMQRGDFYSHDCFKGIKLPSETNRLLRPVDDGPLTVPQAPQLRAGHDATALAVREDLSPGDILRLNRILLEACFPREILPSRHSDVMRCISLADGTEIWRLAYPVKVKRNHGMSRTVPAVTDDYVVSIGPKCHVLCLDARTGQPVWGIDLQEQFNTEEPEWYAGQCPLIDAGKAIIAPGGSSLMIAVELSSGKIIWQAPNPRRWKMTHSSIVPMDFAGKRMYVYCGSGGVAGIDAGTGETLWESTEWKISIATVPTPVIVGEDKIFLSGGYGAGCMMMQLTSDGGQISARPLWRLKAEEFGSVQQTPLLYDGHIFGMRPDGQLACTDLSGKLKWKSGPAHRFGQGLGPYIIADGLLLVMNDTGLLTMVEATSEGYRELAQAQVLQGGDSWGPMAIADGRLLARDLTSMVCLELEETAAPGSGRGG